MDHVFDSGKYIYKSYKLLLLAGQEQGSSNYFGDQAGNVNL